MTALGHVAAASLFRGHPLLRLAWGFISHWILDVAVDEYRPKGLHFTNYRTWSKHSEWLMWQVTAVILFWVVTRDPWAILYGTLPDILEGVYIKIRLLLGTNVWMSGKLLFPFHRVGADYLVKLTAYGTVGLEIVLLAVVFAGYG